MEKLELTYIHSTNLAANDTSETFVVNNALSLAENGAKVNLIVINSGENDASSLIRQRYNLEELPRSLQVFDYQNQISTKFFFYLYACYQVSKLPLSGIIITRSHEVLRYLMILFGKSKKIFFETHDYFYDLEVRDDINKKRKKTKSAIEKKYFKKLTGLISLNSYQANLYRKHLKNVQIKVFPTGLKQVHRSESIRSEDIIYVGSLNERSGAGRLAQLILECPEQSFKIVGGKNNQELDYFKALFPDNKVPKNARITGWLNKEELRTALLNGSIGLLPLTETFFNRYLTVPLKLFDYFSHGLITLAPRFPTCEDFIEDGKTGFLVDWNHISKVKNLLKRPYNHQMREAIYNQAQSMTWKARAQNQIAYFIKKSNDV